MGETNDLQRMRGLIDKLNEASRRYYDQNESDISDDEWDAMYAELRKLEEKTGERMADSPTRRVGGAVMEGFEQHRHIARLWSMDKAQSEEEILAWAQRCEKQTTEAGGLPKNSYCVEYKLDGLTVNLTYDGGRLIQAATRGNGEVGEAILPAGNDHPHHSAHNSVHGQDGGAGRRHHAAIRTKKIQRNVC